MNSTLIIKPIITEKSAVAETMGMYTFHVAPTANKIEVEKEIEKLYGVKVKKVRIMHVIKKQRLFGKGRTMTKRSAFKKAIVYLADAKTALDIIAFKK